MPIKLVSNGGPDEVGPVGVEALLDEEIDMAEVDIAEVDRDLLAVCRLGPKFVYIARHSSHPSPSGWMAELANSSPSLSFPELSLLGPAQDLCLIERLGRTDWEPLRRDLKPDPQC